MLNYYYYNHQRFQVGIFAYFVFMVVCFFAWYQKTLVAESFAWIPMLSCAVAELSIVLFPTRERKLPFFMLPAIILMGLLTNQYMLSKLPPNLAPITMLWPLQITIVMCGVLILRSHIFAAWTLFGLTALLFVKNHLGVFISTGAILAECLVPMALLGGIHVFQAQIQQSFHKARQSRLLLQSAEMGRAQEESVSNIATQRVQEVTALTQDMLHRIAYNPAPVTATDIDEFRFTEAQLRDTIRGRHLVNSQILEATMAARRRGVKVDILDERGEALPEHITQVLTECALEVLIPAQSGTVTIRAFPKDDPTAVMLVHDGNSSTEDPVAIEIAQKTGEVERF